MALIFRGWSKCSICSEILETDDRVYATSHFLGREHFLWRYSDSGMHWDCFEKWEHREAFVKELVSVRAACSWGDGSALVYSGAECTVVVHVLEELQDYSSLASELSSPRLSEDPTVAVWLHSVGQPLCTKLSEWESWLSSDPGFASKLMQESWKAVAEELSKISSESLIQGIDRDALLRDRKEKVDQFLKQSQLESAEREKELMDHNLQLHSILQTEPVCPHCEAPFVSLKYYDNRHNSRRSCVICQACGRSSRVAEFRGLISW